MNTDTQRTLQLLKDAGERGVHSFDLNKLVGTTRAAARVQDLKDKGYQITSIHEKKGDSMGVRYFLNNPLMVTAQEQTTPNGRIKQLVKYWDGGVLKQTYI